MRDEVELEDSRLFVKAERVLSSENDKVAGSKSDRVVGSESDKVLSSRSEKHSEWRTLL